MSLLVANWKMQLSDAESAALAAAVAAADLGGTDVVLCPSFTALPDVRRVVYGTRVGLGAQDCAWEARASLTGEVSPADLAALGCRYVIVGHSERRLHLGETDAMVARKLQAVLEHGLQPILCVGESEEQWRSGAREEVIAEQVRSALTACAFTVAQPLIVAYEPVWAIGSGHPAAPMDAAHAASLITKVALEQCGTSAAFRTLVLYGGSVDAENARAFLDADGIQGFLVGTASQSADELLGLLAAIAGR